jgi:hypothetical protein
MGCGCLLAGLATLLGLVGLLDGLIDLLTGGPHALEDMILGAVWTAGGIGCFFLLAWMDRRRIFTGGSGGGRGIGGDDEELSELDYLADGRLDGHIGPRGH